MSSWLWLLVAIALEVAGTSCMKLSDGFERLVPSVAIFVCYGLSLGALTLALRGIEVSVAYAVWSGVGTALVAGIGVAAFAEGLSLRKVLCVALIVAGAVGLHGLEADRAAGASPPAREDAADQRERR